MRDHIIVTALKTDKTAKNGQVDDSILRGFKKSFSAFTSNKCTSKGRWQIKMCPTKAGSDALKMYPPMLAKIINQKLIDKSI